MKTKVLQDYKNTESGPCLIIGNGPSLKDAPFGLLDGIPNFACNFFPMYMHGVGVDHLVMIDRASMKSDKLWDVINPLTLVFCFAKWAGTFPRHDNAVWWVNKHNPIKGFTSSNLWGQYFPTSAHAAVWIGDAMGYDEFFLIGMDGTSQERELAGTDEEGRSNVPHFYDDHPGKNSMLWDIAWGNIAHFLGEKGKSITNLSTQTAITQIERRDYNDFWESDTGLWKRPWGGEHSGSAAFFDANLRNESMAGTPQDNPGALDSLGYMESGRSPARFAREYLGTPEQADPPILHEYLRGALV